ncbi:MAG: hypothetical protein IJ429_06180 [Lachnospiraceae bacterium]|nr:hypothetical protein [Lachnospiraceae bacterium]
MGFQSVNELEQFSFQDAQIKQFTVSEGVIALELEAVIVKARNSQNANFTDSYAGTLSMRLLGGNIQKAVKEGYKYYDANDVLVEEIPDQPLSEDEISALIKGSKDYYLFDVVKVEDDQNKTGHFLYLFGVDADEETSYWFQIEFDKSILEWERYMNRVQTNG